MGDSHFSPIPEFRPSHCPFARISNASQPTPSDINTVISYTIIHSYNRDIIHPRRRFPLHYLCAKNQSCEV